MDLKNSTLTLSSEASEVVTEMRKKNRHLRTYDVAMALLLVLAGGAFFYALSISIAESSWVMPLLVFSVYIVLFLLFAVTGGIKKAVIIATGLTFCSSMMFAPHLEHMGVILIALLIMWRSVIKMRSALFRMITVDVGHAMYIGIISFIVAVSLVITSQYYWTVVDFESSRLMHKITESNSSTFAAVGYIVEKVSPRDSDAREESSGTIDAMLMQIQQDADEEPGVAQTVQQSALTSISESLGLDAEAVRALTQSVDDSIPSESFVAASRIALSENIGIPLNGSEKVADVAAQFMRLQAQRIIEESPAVAFGLPLVLALLLFVTLVSVGSLLRYPWIWIARGVFWLLKFYGTIKIIHVPKNVEVIKY